MYIYIYSIVYIYIMYRVHTTFSHPFPSAVSQLSEVKLAAQTGAGREAEGSSYRIGYMEVWLVYIGWLYCIYIYGFV